MSDEVRADGNELSARVGELRRLTFMYCDIVGSTELSGRQEPETYRELMRGYRDACRDVIEARFEGHIVRVKGDGALSTFGFPIAHENDAERAVRAGLALVRAVQGLSTDTTAKAGESLNLRVGIHHGPVYLDFDEGDIYGLAANVGARLQDLADPGTVVVSEEVRQLVEDCFELDAREPQAVKGVAEPLTPYMVLGERAAPAERSWSSPLVEREGELAQLSEAWAPVVAGKAGRATGLLLRGDAGVGKSRLVAALDDRVCGGGACFVELHGSPFHVDAGFHPVRTLIEARSGIDDDANPSERLERLEEEVTSLGLDGSETIPFLAPVLGIDPSTGYDEAATEGRKLEEQVTQAVLAYVVACTQGRPAIVVAENLHWFDDATRALLADLLRDGPGSVLVVATSRTPEGGAWDTIELRPLSLDGRLALIDALDEGLSEEDRLALAARSDGIPLYLEELVRAGSVQHPGAPDAPAPVPGAVPEVLYEPLVARLYARPAALPVAATAAAAGQEVDRALLAATMSISLADLDSALGDLVDARVLEPVTGRPARYQFRHELLREVAYELQPPSWRRKVHSRLSDLFSREETTDWRILASHFELAERFREAAEAYQETAEWARRRGALEEARLHLKRAIELAGELTRDETRDHLEVGLRLRRASLAMTADGVNSPDASADFDRCLELTETEPRGDDMFSTLISVWSYDLSRGELDRARQVSEALRAGVGGGRDYFRPQMLAGFGMLDWFAGSFARAEAGLAIATDDLATIGREDEVDAVWFVPNDSISAIRVHLACARFMVADLAGADESLGLARARSASLDFPQGPWSAAYAMWLGSWMWMEAGRLDLADETLADLRSSSAAHGFDSWELVAATQTAALEAVTALRTGVTDSTTLSEHAQTVGALVEVWQMLGLQVFVPFYLTTAGAVLAAAGDVDGARQRYDESLALAAETGMLFYDAETMRRRAHLAPDREAVAENLHTALELARSQAARPFELRIALDLHELLGDSANSLLERAIRPFDGGVAITELVEARARVMTLK